MKEELVGKSERDEHFSSVSTASFVGWETSRVCGGTSFNGYISWSRLAQATVYFYLLNFRIIVEI